MKRLLALLSLLLVLPMSAHAWWNADWKFRKKITLDANALSAEAGQTAELVPVAVRLHTGNFLFSDAKPDGSDIRFVAADDKTPLKHHVEMFDAANQLAILWVQVPRVVSKAPNEALWLYSGNEKVGAADDAKGVYSPAQRLRLNFAEADGAFKDASPYANAVAIDGVTRGAAGLAGGSAVFAGKPLKVAMSDASRVQPGAGAGLSFSAWVKPSAGGSAQLFVWGPLVVEANDSQLVVRMGGLQVAAPALKVGQWQHVGLSLSDRLALFVDGREVGTQPVALPAFSGELSLGQGFNGELDAVEVSAVPRNALWHELQAAQGEDGKLLAYGEPEQGAAGEDHAGYIAVLMNSLTLDAKIVIVILAVMFVIAVYVMVAKAYLVSKLDRNNGRFIDAFEEQPHLYLDPQSAESKQLREGDPARDGSLSRMYATGMRELDRRVNSGRKISSLSAESVAAIKASIDSTLIRENQKLNKLMVLLTIAISGGPFLGLLGTVVGVMITFAAIAAAGDVNINAIAPGIAAALLATVAGLGVAIPALFGYNYLLTRIKNITADMQAFSDEFITRMAEAHNQ
jgi:biopolymer transport protein ExbB